VINEIENVESTNINNKREIHVNVIGLPVNKVQKIEHIESPQSSSQQFDVSYSDDPDNRKTSKSQTNRRSYS
jgi:hypothetical protein